MTVLVYTHDHDAEEDVTEGLGEGVDGTAPVDAAALDAEDGWTPAE